MSVDEETQVEALVELLVQFQVEVLARQLLDLERRVLHQSVAGELTVQTQHEADPFLLRVRFDSDHRSVQREHFHLLRHRPPEHLGHPRDHLESAGGVDTHQTPPRETDLEQVGALVRVQVDLAQEDILQVVIGPDDTVRTVDDYLLPTALQLQHLGLLVQLGLLDLLVLGVVIVIDAVQVVLVLGGEKQVGALFCED